MCAESGIQDYILAKWLGHTNVATTKKYYIKVRTKHENEQVTLITNLIK